MESAKNRNVATVALGAIVTLAFLLYMVMFSVPFYQTAVVTTLGKVTRAVTEPSLCFKWPWPFQQVTLFDNRLRVNESKLEQLLTADKQTLTVSTFTAWRVSPDEQHVLTYLKRIGREADRRAEETLTALAHDAMGKVVGEHNFDDFVNTDPERMKFDAIEKQLTALIKDKALQDYGIDVAMVGIKRLELPEETTKKVFERMKQERQRLAKEFRAQGESTARQIRAEARLRAQEIKDRATAEAIAIRGKGDAEAARYYTVFKQNPELHNFLKRLETLEKILPRQTTLILEAADVPPFDVLRASFLESLLGPKSSDARSGGGAGK